MTDDVTIVMSMDELSCNIDHVDLQRKLNSVRLKSEFLTDKVIGAGAFGCVFRATHLVDKSSYAVKVISVEDREQIINKKLEEVFRMAQLHHPGIIRYHNAWIEKPTEETHLCEESLSKWLKRNTEPRDTNQMKSWFKQITTALQYIHSKNVIHRDLKPGNVLVASDDVVKICDLGIAADSDIGTSEWRTNVGTPLYKAPEQSFAYDKRVDIYSLGLILIELFVVLTDARRSEIFRDILCGKTLDILSDSPSTLDLVTKLTKLNPDDRPTCEQILSHSFFPDNEKEHLPTFDPMLVYQLLQGSRTMSISSTGQVSYGMPNILSNLFG